MSGSNRPLKTGSLGHNLYTNPAWYPVLESNQPVRVRSAESSSLGRGEMERARRFELPSLAWKAKVLPLDDARLE